MKNVEINKEYLLKLGEANPVDSIYLGIKRYKGNISKPVFLVYDLDNRNHLEYRFYLGEMNNTTFKQGIINIKNPVYKKVDSIEKVFLSQLIWKFKKQ